MRISRYRATAAGRDPVACPVEWLCLQLIRDKTANKEEKLEKVSGLFASLEK